MSSRTTRQLVALSAAPHRRQNGVHVKAEGSPTPEKPPTRKRKAEVAPLVKHEVSNSPDPVIKKVSLSELKDKKLKLHASMGTEGPFPTFSSPTPADCETALRILVEIHGPRTRPKQLIASTTRAGCGDSPSVLDALVRTILSQNTSDLNSTRAKLSMDAVYGASDNWDAVAAGGPAKLEEAIRCGGLSAVKSKVIMQILEQSKTQYGRYSLDHLHSTSTEQAMNELLSFNGVGPKTASCVLLFCLQRDDFAVDTHVQRITGQLGWRPKTASREQTYHHLNRRIPDSLKYGLHVLLVTHGKQCDECKAGGKKGSNCSLRKEFQGEARRGKVKDMEQGL